VGEAHGVNQLNNLAAVGPRKMQRRSPTTGDIAAIKIGCKKADDERGTCASSSEVIREALRERYKRQTLQELDAALDRAIADIEAGRSMPVEQAFAHVRNKRGLNGKSKRR
jgi:antitoxin ParD1/3/4